MATIGCLSYSGVGHVSPMSSLAAELQRRGHRIVYFQRPDLASRISNAGLAFEPYGASEMPVGSLARELAEISAMQGAEAFERILAELCREAELMFRDVPPRLLHHGVDFLLIDQCFDAGGALAQRLAIPYASIALALPFETEPGIPCWGSSLPYSLDTEMIRLQQDEATALGAMVGPLMDHVNQLVINSGGQPVVFDEHFSGFISRLAIVSQLPACFDFPRRALPLHFHATGPFNNNASLPEVPFPWDQLDGRPLVFASLGTLQNRLPAVFSCIAEAAAGLPIQLVLSLGSGLTRAELGPLPGNPLVVSYAPQRQLLERAALMITHAGMNTALDCASLGVPMVAIPITHDQPNIAQRIVYHRCGEMVTLADLTPATLAQAIQQVLTSDTYRLNAQQMAAAISQLNGRHNASNIIEQAIATGAPVLRP